MNPYSYIDIHAWYVWKQLSNYLSNGLEYNQEFWDTFCVDYLDDLNGAQASIACVNHPNRPSISCILKLSQGENNIIQHEYRVLRAINRTLDWLPYIPRVYYIVKYKGYVDPKMAINYENRKTVDRYGLLLEEIKHVGSLADFIKTKSVPIIVSILKQVLLCIRIFRRHRITHYDLHTENILIRKCPDELCVVYDMGAGADPLYIKTYGYMPVIIDYGFSYIDHKEGKNEPIYAELHSVCHGYLCDRFMPMSDYIRVIHSIASDITQKFNFSKIKLKKILRKLFDKCDTIDYKTGWETTYKEDMFACLYSKVNLNLRLLESVEWLNALQMMASARRPLSAGAVFNEQPFKTFAGEWAKVERRITNLNTLTYLFKHLVKTIDTNADARQVKVLFLDELTRLVNSFIPNAIDFGKLVGAVQSMAHNMNILFTAQIAERERDILRSYACLPFTIDNCDDFIWQYIESNYGRDVEGPLDVKWQLTETGVRS